jgi:hypothetical protein
MEIATTEPAEKFVKLSITLPPHLARLAEEKVAAGGAPSLSALVARALQHELVPAEDELDELFRDWLASGKVVITEENRAWARKVLDL